MVEAADGVVALGETVLNLAAVVRSHVDGSGLGTHGADTHGAGTHWAGTPRTFDGSDGALSDYRMQGLVVELLRVGMGDGVNWMGVGRGGVVVLGVVAALVLVAVLVVAVRKVVRVMVVAAAVLGVIHRNRIVVLVAVVGAVAVGVAVVVAVVIVVDGARGRVLVGHGKGHRGAGQQR